MHPFWVHDRDDKGRIIDSRIIDSLQRKWASMQDYLKRNLNDTSCFGHCIDILKNSLSNALRDRSELLENVNELDAYVWDSFKHVVSAKVEENTCLEQISTQQDHEQLGKRVLSHALVKPRVVPATQEREFFVKERLSLMPAHVQAICNLIEQGYRWREIAQILQISEANAKGELAYWCKKIHRLDNPTGLARASRNRKLRSLKYGKGRPPLLRGCVFDPRSAGSQ